MPRNRLLIKKEIEAYAEVLLELGESTDSVYSISAQLEEMKKVVRMHPGLRDVLANDSIDENTRATVIHEVFKEFSVDMIKFVIVMAERQDIPLLPRVAECYDQMVQDKYDVVILDVATVIPLDDELREKFKSKFAAQFGKEIVLREHVDAWLLKAPIGPHCLAQGSRLGSQRSFRHHMPRKHNPMFFTPFTQRIRKSFREALRNVVMEKIPRLGHLSVRLFPEHFRQCI